MLKAKRTEWFPWVEVETMRKIFFSNWEVGACPASGAGPGIYRRIASPWAGGGPEVERGKLEWHVQEAS